MIRRSSMPKQLTGRQKKKFIKKRKKKKVKHGNIRNK